MHPQPLIPAHAGTQAVKDAKLAARAGRNEPIGHGRVLQKLYWGVRAGTQTGEGRDDCRGMNLWFFQVPMNSVADVTGWVPACAGMSG
jgi:hypothetical protein